MVYTHHSEISLAKVLKIRLTTDYGNISRKIVLSESNHLILKCTLPTMNQLFQYKTVCDENKNFFVTPAL